MNKDQTMVNNIAKAVLSLFEKFLDVWSGKVAVEESLNLDDLVKSQMPQDFQETYFNLR